jgi:ferredoxin
MTSSLSVEVDQELCIGSGDCVLAAPRAFLLEDRAGTVTVLATVAIEPADALTDASMNCPTGAIRLVEGA